jgi:hypothetical protein
VVVMDVGFLLLIAGGTLIAIIAKLRGHPGPGESMAYDGRGMRGEVILGTWIGFVLSAVMIVFNLVAILCAKGSLVDGFTYLLCFGGLTLAVVWHTITGYRENKRMEKER